MPLLMSPCVLDDANSLAQAHLASSKHYLKITNTATNQIAAYATWIPVPHPSPHRCRLDDEHDPWLLSPSELMATHNGLCIGLRERLWSSCLYREARTASKVRRLWMKAREVQRLCGKRMRGARICGG